MREGRYFKTTAAKKHTVADLIKRYLEYQKTRNPKRAESVTPFLSSRHYFLKHHHFIHSLYPRPKA